MDLKEQLVIWKRAGLLMDSISLTPKFCDMLVEEGLFDASMMAKVQAKTYNLERTLMVLTLLGTHGTDVFNKFLAILTATDHHRTHRELKKTQKFLKYGEMLPPSFTYFQDISEFLKLYPHIAIKLGEQEKHLVHTFIEGKIEVAARKTVETIKTLNKEVGQLNNIIKGLKKEVQKHVEREQLLEEKLNKSNERIVELKERMKELELLSAEHQNESRRLRHYKVQQEDLERFMEQKREELGLSFADFEIGLLNTLSRQATAIDPIAEISPDEKKGSLSRQPSMVEKQGSKISQKGLGSRQNSRTSLKAGLGHRQNSKLGSRQLSRTKSQLDMKKRQNYNIKSRLMNLQLNVLASKLFYMQLNIQRLSNEEQAAKAMLDKGNLDKAMINEVKKSIANLHKEKKSVKETMKEGDREVLVIEDAMEALRKDVFGTKSSKSRPPTQQMSENTLVKKIQILLKHISNSHGRDLRDMQDKQDKEIADLMKHIQDMNEKHFHEVGAVRGRLRLKMGELHRREMLHRRLRTQIHVMVRYNAKNMNATVSVEQCRKITRGIIQEARKLRDIAEEAEMKAKKKKVPTAALR